jgi:hypothetical protein
MSFFLPADITAYSTTRSTGGKDVMKVKDDTYTLTLTKPDGFDENTAFAICKSIRKGYLAEAISSENIVYLMDSVHCIGFMVIKKGECKFKPEWWSLSLICSKSGTGPILLGLYVYIIKKYSHNNGIAILDLASGLINIAGTCSYPKVGFEFLSSLPSLIRHGITVSNCYDADDGWIANSVMICDVRKFSTLQDIIDTVVGEIQFTKPPECSLDTRLHEMLLRYNERDQKLIKEAYLTCRQFENMVNELKLLRPDEQLAKAKEIFGSDDTGKSKKKEKKTDADFTRNKLKLITNDGYSPLFFMEMLIRAYFTDKELTVFKNLNLICFHSHTLVKMSEIDIDMFKQAVFQSMSNPKLLVNLLVSGSLSSERKYHAIAAARRALSPHPAAAAAPGMKERQRTRSPPTSKNVTPNKHEDKDRYSRYSRREQSTRRPSGGQKRKHTHKKYKKRFQKGRNYRKSCKTNL